MLKGLAQLAAHAGFRRYFSNTAWMLGEQLLRLVSALLVGIWVARYLGPQQFGVFSYALAFAALFAGVAKLGLDAIVVRELVDTPGRRELVLGTAFRLKLAGGLLSLALVAALLFGLPHEGTTRLYVLIVAAGVLFQPFEAIDFHFQSRVEARFVSLCRMVQLLLSSGLRIGLVLADAELVYFVWVTLIDQIVLALALLLAYRLRGGLSFVRRFDAALAKDMLARGWPLIFSSLVIMIYMRIDQIMIGRMLGDSALGLYSAAVRLSEVWYFIPMIICSSLFPAIIGARRQDEALYHRRLQRLYTLMLWLALAIAVPMSLIGPWLLTLLFGPEYRAAAPVLVVHIWATVFVFLGVASSSWLSSENLQKLAFYRTLVGAVVNVLLNLLLIPRLGLLGAALATLIAQMTAACVYDLFSARTRPMFMMKMRALNPAHLYRGSW